jgi:hypothetical protein
MAVANRRLFAVGVARRYRSGRAGSTHGASAIETTSNLQKGMKAHLRYIEKHHEEYGVALFILPMLLVVMVVISIAYGLASLLE